MKQQDLGLNLSKRRTRKMELLELMDSVVPWPELVAKLNAVASVKATGRLVRAWFDRNALTKAMGLTNDQQILLTQTVGYAKR